MHRARLVVRLPSHLESFVPLAARRSRKKMSWTCHGRSNADLVDKLQDAELVKDEKVVQAMRAVDRAFFCKVAAYNDAPQCIGYGATISAPHMHATCLQLLKDQLLPGNKVLDVGSGSGYLTCILRSIVGRSGKAVGIEHIQELTQRATDSAMRLDFGPEAMADRSLEFVTGDGMRGWPQEGPYNAIHVGASAAQVPEALLEQLVPGGRMVLPVGGPGERQSLAVIDRGLDGGFTREDLMGVQYVPLTSREEQLRGQRRPVVSL